MHGSVVSSFALGSSKCPASQRAHTSTGFSRADSNALASCSGRQAPPACSSSRPSLRNGIVAGALPVSIRQAAHSTQQHGTLYLELAYDCLLQVKDVTQSYLSEQDLFREEQLDTTLQVPSLLLTFSSNKLSV